MARSSGYDPINGSTGALFPGSGASSLPPATGGQAVPGQGKKPAANPMDPFRDMIHASFGAEMPGQPAAPPTPTPAATAAPAPGGATGPVSMPGGSPSGLPMMGSPVSGDLVNLLTQRLAAPGGMGGQ
jgi:hypothetical protein